MRGGLTGKGGPAGHKERPEETRGQKDWEGKGLRSGAGRNPGAGQRARPLRERERRALPQAVGEATRQGATPTRERGLYLARPEVKKQGFKQENVAKSGVYAEPGPKPPQKLLKPKRKDNWAAKAAAAFIRGRAPGAQSQLI